MLMFNFYWFYDLLEDRLIPASKAEAESIYLNLPQQYVGPFKSKEGIKSWKELNPNASKNFNKALEEMRPYYETNYI